MDMVTDHHVKQNAKIGDPVHDIVYKRLRLTPYNSWLINDIPIFFELIRYAYENGILFHSMLPINNN